MPRSNHIEEELLTKMVMVLKIIRKLIDMNSTDSINQEFSVLLLRIYTILITENFQDM